MMSDSVDGDDGSSNSRKRMVPTRSTSDIISNLPCNIVDNILICLPIRDAARTSVLSRKWRFKWLSISQLVFDSTSDDFFRSTSPTNPKIIWSRIYQILLLHRSPLHKLVIDVDEQVGNASSLLNQIILFLSGKDIHDFTLHPPEMGTKYTLPSTLFLCTHLARLHLIGCMFRLPAEYIGFSKLISVQLVCVDFSADDFKTFLSKCPLLQRLKLEYCKKGNPIEIDAPNLKFLYFDCAGISIIFKNVPVLSTLIIRWLARLPGKSSNSVEMFGSLPAIEYFSAWNYFWTDFNAGVERLPSMLNHLKYVELCGFCFSSSKEVQFALLMIRSSPNLHRLKMELDECDEFYSDVDDVPVISLCLVEDSFNQLREVVMKDFNGIVRELEFIELLLAKSLVLKKIMIQPDFEIPDKKLLEISKAVNQFQRASPEAQVIFLDSVKVDNV